MIEFTYWKHEVNYMGVFTIYYKLWRDTPDTYSVLYGNSIMRKIDWSTSDHTQITEDEYLLEQIN